jgi:hypothetical protein
MTAFQQRQAAEASADFLKANPIIATFEFGSQKDMIMGNAGVLTASKRENGTFLIQLRRGGCIPFQKFYQTIEEARKGWVIAKSMI